jgi:hypothetical protein
MKYLQIFTMLALILSININSYKKEIGILKSKAVTSNYNKEYGILIDYGLHSGKNRMLLVSLKEEKIIYSLPVAHGSGSNAILSIPTKFSNISGSNASSLGYSVITDKGRSSYGIGINYVLEGLSPTNSNMRKRHVVLHSHTAISPFSTFPIPTIQSKGCPAISNIGLRYLDKFIQGQKNKKILIYSFK